MWPNLSSFTKRNRAILFDVFYVIPIRQNIFDRTSRRINSRSCSIEVDHLTIKLLQCASRSWNLTWGELVQARTEVSCYNNRDAPNRSRHSASIADKLLYEGQSALVITRPPTCRRKPYSRFTQIHNVVFYMKWGIQCHDWDFHFWGSRSPFDFAQGNGRCKILLGPVSRLPRFP